MPLYGEQAIREHSHVHSSFLKLDGRRKQALQEYKDTKDHKNKLEAAHRA